MLIINIWRVRMGKLNVKKWIERFEMLSPESQLEVADAIERELHLNNEFPSERFQGRLYGFSWVLLETRDPSYNPESLKREHHLLWVLKALDFATDKEKAVFDKLVEIIGNKKNGGNERLALLGAVEGKKVVYQGISPELLIKNQKI